MHLVQYLVATDTPSEGVATQDSIGLLLAHTGLQGWGQLHLHKQSHRLITITNTITVISGQLQLHFQLRFDVVTITTTYSSTSNKWSCIHLIAISFSSVSPLKQHL